ncbi:uncharacterized protein LOC144605305 [Rhinoraja longicauda]
METMRTFFILLREVVNSTRKDYQAPERRGESRTVIWAGGRPYLLKINKCLVTYLILMIINTPPTLAHTYEKVIRGELGGNATLPCFMEDGNTEGLQVIWQTHENWVAWVFRNNEYQQEFVHPFFRNRAKVSISGISSGDLSMNLQQLQLNDSREYKCIIIRPDGTPTTYSITLTVTEPDVVMEVIKPFARNYSNSTNTGQGSRRRERYFLLIPVASCLLLAVVFVIFQIETELLRITF